MSFFGRLLHMLALGLILGMLVGLLFNSPALAVGAFLFWCASKQKNVFSAPSKTEEPEQPEDEES